MSQLLIARLGDNPVDPIAWAAFADDALMELGRCPNVETFGDIARSFDPPARIAAVMRGEAAAVRPLATPSKNAAKFRAAAALLLEDELAEPIEDVHVAINQTGGQGRAFAVKKDIMRDWVDAFADAGAPLSVLTIDYGGLEGSPERPVIFIEPNRMIASVGERGFAADHSIGRAAAKAIMDEREPDSIVAYGPESWLSKLDETLYEPAGPADDEAMLVSAAAAIAAGSAPNLLQGAFKPARRRSLEVRRFQRAGLMAASLIGLIAGLVIVDSVRAGRVAARYAEEARALHRAAFPDAADQDPRAHARAALSQNAGASFLKIAQSLNAALAENDAVAIDRIRFDRDRGQFIFSIRSQSDSDIEAFRNRLEAFGVAATDSSGYRRSGAAWVGEMSVRL